MVQNRASTTNQPRERQMRAEYITKYMRGKRWYTEYPLGRAVSPEQALTMTPSQIRAYDNRKARCDLLVAYSDHLDIIEFKIVDAIRRWCPILMYRELVIETDTLKAYWNMPINLRLIVAMDDPILKRTVEKYGIAYEVYTPEWLPQYMETLRPRDLSPSSLIPGAST